MINEVVGLKQNSHIKLMLTSTTQVILDLSYMFSFHYQFSLAELIGKPCFFQRLSFQLVFTGCEQTIRALSPPLSSPLQPLTISAVFPEPTQL